MWDERDEVRDAALALVVLTYCLHVISELAGLTRQLRRDSLFFYSQSFSVLKMIINVIDVDSSEIEQATMAAIVRAMELFSSQDFSDDADPVDI